MTQAPRTIYARRIAGDLYDATYSYHAGADPEVTLAYLQRAARQDRAVIEIDRSGFRAAGEAATEVIRDFAGR